MDLLIVLALLGLLQTLIAAAASKGGFLPILFYFVFLGALAIGIHPWVLRINFVRFNELASAPTTAALISSLLVVEAILKAFWYVRDDVDPQTDRHWVIRLGHWLSRIAGKCVPFTPSLMLFFFLFYSQSYLFHTTESLSFKTISWIYAGVVISGFSTSTWLLRRCFSRNSLNEAQFLLLFVQFVVAIVIPVLTREAHVSPNLYDPGIYIRFAAAATGMLLVTGVGFFIHTLSNKYRLNRTK